VYSPRLSQDWYLRYCHDQVNFVDIFSSSPTPIRRASTQSVGAVIVAVSFTTCVNLFAGRERERERFSRKINYEVHTWLVALYRLVCIEHIHEMPERDTRIAKYFSTSYINCISDYNMWGEFQLGLVECQHFFALLHVARDWLYCIFDDSVIPLRQRCIIKWTPLVTLNWWQPTCGIRGPIGCITVRYTPVHHLTRYWH